LICGENGCLAECRVKSEDKEVRNGVEYDVQIYYCVKHGDRYKKLYADGEETILEQV